jgi:16S rRNA (adenine1518-N6/adenine1519-N6)-dimethyltransferase
VVARIADALGAEEGETVVEIGPGRGALTTELLDRGLRVLALEIDPLLAAVLQRTFGERKFFLECGDALETDLGAALARIEAVPPVPLVGNLPYESATPMLRRFVRRADLVTRIVAMIQKEVAERLVAPPGGEAYGFLSVDVGVHARARKLFDVLPGSFDPPPQVHSSVVELLPHPPVADAKEALVIASAGFAARRKTLVNALTPRWGRERAVAAVAEMGWPPTVRAETLGIEDFRKLIGPLGPPPH